MTLFAIVILIHLSVIVYSSNSNDEMLNLLLNPFSKKGFILKWITLFLTAPVLLAIYLLSFLCA
jgi:hypothetical protein